MAEDVLSYSVTLENDDGPVFVGANISKGNRVKNMETIAFPNEVILFVESDITMSDFLVKMEISQLKYTVF